MLTDVTCDDCRKKEYCKQPCIFIERLAGKDKGTRELIPPPNPRQISCVSCPKVGECLGRCEKTDYNVKLVAIQAKKAALKRQTIVDIRGLQGIRLRAITALLYAGFKVREIPYIVEKLNIKKSQLYEIMKGDR